MANKTINEFTVLSGAIATDDEVLIWDTSAGVTRKITKANLMGGAITGGGTIATAGFTLTGTKSGNVLVSTETPTTWTPGIAFGGNAVGVTYSQQYGHYVRYGPLIFFSLQMVLTSKGSSTGNATITGFPVTAGAVVPSVTYFVRWQNMTSSLVAMTMQLNNGSTAAVLQAAAAATTSLNSVTDAAFANNSILFASGFYFA